MNVNQLKKIWLSEEKESFVGWDFSFISNRISEEALPWDYRNIVKSHMDYSVTLLDMGTGGGEFLLSLQPPRGRTYATESYPPNFELCQKKLPMYGIDIRQVYDDNDLPFDDCSFDLIINRHESFTANEIFRLLKPGGVFITQQVGGQNNRELSSFLLGDHSSRIDPEFNLQSVIDDLVQFGFAIIDAREYFPICKYYDVGAFVYYAKVIEWEFPNFSVDRCFAPLCELQKKIEDDGFFTSIEHRFLIVCRKPATPS